MQGAVFRIVGSHKILLFFISGSWFKQRSLYFLFVTTNMLLEGQTLLNLLKVC